MLGSTILILEPALGRLLPMPLIMPWGELLVMVIQLGVLWLVVRHDRASLGAVHPATKQRRGHRRAARRSRDHGAHRPVRRMGCRALGDLTHKEFADFFLGGSGERT